MNYEPVLHVVLYQPEIPYNTGSVGRTCVAMGAKLWLVRPLGFRVDDYYLRRAGLDYWELLEWEVVDDWAALVARLGIVDAMGKTAGGVASGAMSNDSAASSAVTPWLFTKNAVREYSDATFQHGDVLIFGCETAGLPASMLAAYADRTLRISTRAAVRSLNLSNAAAIVMYEAVRQGIRANDLGERPEGDGAL